MKSRLQAYRHKISPEVGLILRGWLATSVTITAEAGDEENPDKPFAAIVVVTTTTVTAKETATTIVAVTTAA